MATGTAGSTARQYHQQMTHYLRGAVAYNTVASGETVSLGTIPSGAVITSVDVLVETAFNAGTTNVLIVGNASDDDAYLAAGDVDETATGLTRYSTKGAKVSADTEILAEYTQSGTAASAGAATIIVHYVPDNDG